MGPTPTRGIKPVKESINLRCKVKRYIRTTEFSQTDWSYLLNEVSALLNYRFPRPLIRNLSSEPADKLNTKARECGNVKPELQLTARRDVGGLRKPTNTEVFRRKVAG